MGICACSGVLTIYQRGDNTFPDNLKLIVPERNISHRSKTFKIFRRTSLKQNVKAGSDSSELKLRSRTSNFTRLCKRVHDTNPDVWDLKGTWFTKQRSRGTASDGQARTNRRCLFMEHRVIPESKEIYSQRCSHLVDSGSLVKMGSWDGRRNERRCLMRDDAQMTVFGAKPLGRLCFA